ncbi:response regulator transcription factor [Pedobacter gandavensis]|uniref:LytR/AlgR family response regulator transcription factor n=1 Tax=Pedobacter gandavensis TaxID=2679963 RepID=UPI002478DF3A|nr:response regulator transcription factor [Pedobacter gandavensis]WGQ10918.1 response regulator transcription factor [Pedobacter gandavensis]
MTSTKNPSVLSAIAIDDEPIALEVIKNLASEVACIQLVACFTRTKEALVYLQQEGADLIFLDIKMPGLSGIDFLKSLSKPPMVIFTTAYSEHAVQSFELDAIDYLLKPFSFPRFLKACNKAFEHHQLRQQQPAAMLNPSNVIFIKSGYELIKVALEDLLYAESVGNYVQFVSTAGLVRSRLTMVEAEALLSAPAFVRVHRSFLVSSARISKLDKRNVWLGDQPVPVGSMYRSMLEQSILTNPITSHLLK